ncbi:hypothetical protein [Streptomyces sp. I05A-00742]|uniref:hypothetical protein n=1 Tax=Streptomyces sp. I05A-00742 TaxID=2732853 RepID=UPI0014883D1B|nr:hypothetical protein [Streptomyces sp. I05A-00742]
MELPTAPPLAEPVNDAVAIMTGVSGLVTAVAGLITALVGLGAHRRDRDGTAGRPPAQPPQPPAGPLDPPDPPPAGPGPSV